jgi:hypothetical protein
MLRILLIAGFVWAAANSAHAADGVIAATAFEQVPPGTAMAVRPWDDSDQNLAIKQDLENALRHRGYVIREDAPLILSFETRDTVGTWSSGDRRSIVEFEARKGGGEEDDSKVRLNLFASDRGGVFNKGRPPPDVKPSRYQIEVTIDRQGGARLWQGTITADLERTDRESLIKQMVPALVEKVGNTVKGETVPLR